MSEQYPEQSKYALSQEALIAGLKAKKNDAFSHLYDNYSGALFKTIKQIVHDEELAADVLQEVFVQIWKNIESYDSSKSKLYTWMLSVSKNASIDMTRSKVFHKAQATDKYSEDLELHYPALSATPGFDHISFEKTLNHLKNIHRKLIELAFFKGYTHQEIAFMENLPIGTVKTRIRFGLNQLREFWQIETNRLDVAIS